MFCYWVLFGFFKWWKKKLISDPQVSEIGEVVDSGHFEIIGGVAINPKSHQRKFIPFLHLSDMGKIGGTAFFLSNPEIILNSAVKGRCSNHADGGAIRLEQFKIEIQTCQYPLKQQGIL